MPDRDPALEAAVQQAVARRQPDYLSAHPGARWAIECDVTLGYDAALRSLGAGTPEAQQALRELVKASLRRVSAFKAYHDNGEHGPELRRAVNEAAETLFAAQNEFAALATPTEEGK